MLLDRTPVFGLGLSSLPPEEDVENFTDGDLVQTFPADRLARMQLIVVAAPDPPAGQVTALDQIRDEAVRRPLLDPHAFRDLPDPNPGVSRDAVERV
jgi:hypothetical protein